MNNFSILKFKLKPGKLISYKFRNDLYVGMIIKKELNEITVKFPKHIGKNTRLIGESKPQIYINNCEIRYFDIKRMEDWFVSVFKII